MAFSIFERPLPIQGFSFTNIQEYIVKLNETHEGHGQSSALKESIAGSKLFQKNFIEEFRFSEPKEGFTMINCKVKAEQKSISYIICMTINTENEVLHASCECPGGAPPSCCKHTFAVLTFIQDYCAKELHSAQTEKLQEWHRPSKKKKFSPKKVEEVFKSKASSSKKDVKPVNFNALATLPPNAPIFSVIRQSDFDFNSHLIKCTTKLPITHVETFNYKVELKDIKLTLDQILFFKEKVIVTLSEAYNIEEKTINQNNDLWHEGRKLRLTASNFHKIMKRQNDLQKLSHSLLNPADLSHIPAVNFGKQNESKVKELLKKKFKEYVFRNVGLVINPQYPYLGASPDGLFHNSKETVLIEIKSVYNKDKLSLSELCKNRSNFCLKEVNGEFALKKQHQYYTQIQGQLGICQLQHCFFCLSYDKENLHIEKISFDEHFWMETKNMLKDFYFSTHINTLCTDLQQLL